MRNQRSGLELLGVFGRDILSPFLFTLVVDVFSRLLTRSEERGSVNSCVVGRDGGVPTIPFVYFRGDGES